MITLFLLILFCLVLFFYGWQVAKLVLGENKIEALIPLSVAIGIGSYIFLLNISSYLIPIQVNFYLTAIFLLIIGLLMYLISLRSGLRVGWGLTKKEAVLIFVTVFIIMTLNGLILFRTLESDELAGYHLPLATLFAGGNFPPRQANMPTESVAYHYGPDLFMAALFKITNLPIWYTHDFSGFILSGVFFLILFLIARLIVKHNIKSYLIALLAFFAGGFNFYYGFEGVVTLFKKFILNYDIAHPYKFVSLMWEGGIGLGGPIFQYFRLLWGPVGWVLGVVVIYFILKLLVNVGRQRVGLIVLIIILLSTLALSIESMFVVICFALLVYPFIFYLFSRDKLQFKILITNSLIILLISGFLVMVQGGTLPTIVKNSILGKLSQGQPLAYTFFKYPFAFPKNEAASVILPFYSKPFITNFGLLYFLIIPAAIFVCRRYFKASLLLIIISFTSFLVPFVISFNPLWQDTMYRFFHPVNFLWAIIVGVFLFELLGKVKKKKIFALLILISLLIIPLDGLFFQVSRPFYSLRAEGTDPNSFSGRLMPPSDVELNAYQWVKENTTIKDYFLVFEKAENLGSSNIQNYKFIIYTQRFAPIYSDTNNFLYVRDFQTFGNLTHFYQQLIANCHPRLLQELQFKYLFVDDSWPVGLEEQCLAKNQLDLRFNQKRGDKFVRIYQVK